MIWKWTHKQKTKSTHEQNAAPKNTIGSTLLQPLQLGQVLLSVLLLRCLARAVHFDWGDVPNSAQFRPILHSCKDFS